MAFIGIIFVMIALRMASFEMVHGLPAGNYNMLLSALSLMLFIYLLAIARQNRPAMQLICIISFLFFGFQASKQMAAEENNTNKPKVEALAETPLVTPESKAEAHKETFKAAPALNPEDLKNVDRDKQTKEPIEMPEKPKKPEDGEMDDGVTRYSI